jgi:hypothetical protein
MLFEFLLGHDRYLFELRDHGEVYGVERQVFKNEEFWYARRFDPRLDASRPSRELAIAWAEEERKAFEIGFVVRHSADAASHSAQPSCTRCQNELWICEQHPELPWPHDDCHGPGEPCPVCNVSNPPRSPAGFVSWVRVED